MKRFSIPFIVLSFTTSISVMASSDDDMDIDLETKADLHSVPNPNTVISDDDRIEQENLEEEKRVADIIAARRFAEYLAKAHARMIEKTSG